MSQVTLEFLEHNTIAVISLNRPARRNALNRESIEALQHILDKLATKKNVRALLLQGNGTDFCAGADLQWMQQSIHFTLEQNIQDARTLERLLSTLKHFPLPTVAVVQGAVFGGGLGLIACCDVVFSSTYASFCFSEVKLGLIPAIISPFILQALPIRVMQRYFLSAEVFTAAEALQFGFIHDVHDPATVFTHAMNFAHKLINNGPAALSAAKQLIRTLQDNTLSPTALADYTVQCISKLRASPEGQEGIQAFLEKRRPHWQTPPLHPQSGNEHV